MKKILTVSAVCLAGLLILLLLLFTVFQLVMSGRENWPSFSFETLFNGKYFASVSAYYDGDETDVPTDSGTEKPFEETDSETVTEAAANVPGSADSSVPASPETEESHDPVFFALSQTEISLAAGESFYIGVAAFPNDGIKEALYSAVSDSPETASAELIGAAITVTGKKIGSTSVTVYYDNILIGTVKITVSENKEPLDTDPIETDPPENQEFPVIGTNDIDPNRPMLALTFDDGPSKYTDKLLDIFKEYNCRGTFFMIGKQVSAKKSTLIRMVEEGHDLGVHTWNHKNLKTLTLEEIRYEVSSARDKVEEITGVRPNLVRPPYGAVNDTVKEASNLDGFYIINWNIDTLDWQLRDAKLVHDSVMNQAKDGAIILLHDLHKETVEAMVTVIPALIAEGYQLVTVTELLSFSDEAPEFGETIRRQ